MAEFSKAATLFDFKPKETENICEKHNKPLVLFADRELCPMCAQELVNISAQEVAEAETKKAYEKNKLWLTTQSIYSDESLKKASFDTFETVDEETESNKKRARLIAGTYLRGETGNLILTGNVGTGKSHLAMSILKAVNEHSEPYKRCLFMSIDECMRRIKESFSNPKSAYTESRIIDLLTKADLLVIDDLGAEVGAMSSERNASDFNVRTLNAIVNGRMEKPTIFTTNLSSAQMNRMYDDRIVSRVMRGITQNEIIVFKETKDKRNKIEF